jgi:hypothetical protein
MVAVARWSARAALLRLRLLCSVASLAVRSAKAPPARACDTRRAANHIRAIRSSNMATAKHNRPRRRGFLPFPDQSRRKSAQQPLSPDTMVGRRPGGGAPDGGVGSIRRALRDRSPTGALRQIRAGLEIAQSAAHVSSVALQSQAADRDIDVALVLRRIVADEIGRQVERIDLLLGGVAP